MTSVISKQPPLFDGLRQSFRTCDHSPVRPQAKRIGEDHILILMACNDETEVMDRVIADKAYHEECRDCLNNPKTMRQEPAWFRVGLRRMPKEFILPNEALTG